MYPAIPVMTRSYETSKVMQVGGAEGGNPTPQPRSSLGSSPKSSPSPCDSPPDQRHHASLAVGAGAGVDNQSDKSAEFGEFGSASSVWWSHNLKPTTAMWTQQGAQSQWFLEELLRDSKWKMILLPIQYYIFKYTSKSICSDLKTETLVLKTYPNYSAWLNGEQFWVKNDHFFDRNKTEFKPNQWNAVKSFFHILLDM